MDAKLSILLEADDNASKEVKQLAAELKALDKLNIKIDVDYAQLAQARGEAEKLRASLVGLDKTVNIKVQSNAVQQAAVANAAINSVPNTKTTNINANASNAVNNANQATRAINGVPNSKTAKIDAEIARLEAQAARATATLDRLAKKKSSPIVDADIAAAEAKLAYIEQKISELESKRAKIKIEVDDGASQAIDSIGKKLNSMFATAAKETTKLKALVASLAAAFPFVAAAILAIPAALFAIAAPIGAVVAGIGGIKAAAAELQPQFAAIQAAASAAFQQGLVPAVDNVRQTLPALTTGLAGTATALSEVATQVTAVVASQAGLDLLGSTFESINTIIASLAGPAAALTAIFLDLADKGAKGFQDLGQKIDDFAQLWQAAIARMADTGTVEGAVSGLVDIFGALLNVLPPLVEIGAQLAQALGPSLAGAINAVAGALNVIASGATMTVGAFQKLGSAVNSAGVDLSQFAANAANGMGMPGLSAMIQVVAANMDVFGQSATNTTAKLTPLQTAIQNAAAASTQYNNAVAVFGSSSAQAQTALQNLRTATEALAPANKAAADAEVAFGAAVRQFGADSPQAEAAATRLATAKEQMAEADKLAADAAKLLADALRDQLTAFQSLVSSTLAYKESLITIQEKAQKAAEATDKFGAGSLKAQKAQIDLAQAIDGAATNASKITSALTAGLDPLARTQAESNAYTQALGNLASKASGPARTALLGLLAQYDSAALGASSAAAQASGLATKVLTLPNGKQITIILDQTKIPQALAEVAQKGAATKVEPPVVPNTTQVPAAMEGLKGLFTGTTLAPPVKPDTTTHVPTEVEKLKSLMLGTPLAPPVKPDVQPVPPVLNGVQQDAKGAPLGPPVKPDTTGVPSALSGVQQQATQTPINMPVNLDTTNLTTQINNVKTSITALGTSIQGLVTGANSVKTAVDGIATALTKVNPGLTTFNTNLTNVQTKLTTLNTSFTTLNTSFTTFATRLGTLNPALVTFNTNLTNIQTKLTTLNTTFTTLNTGFTTFATRLTTVNPALVTFNTNLTNIQTKLTTLNTALTTLNTGFTNLGTRLTTLNPALVTLNTNLTNIQTKLTTLNTALTTFNTAFTTLATRLTTLNPALVTLNTNLTNIQTKLTTLNPALVTLNTNLTNIQTKLGTFNTSLTTLNTSLTNFATKIGEVITKLTEFTTALQAALDKVNEFAEGIEAAARTIVDSWTGMFDAMITATTDGLNTILDLFDQAMNSLADYLEAWYPTFEAIGYNFAISIANGMLRGQSVVQQAGQALGAAAMAGFNSMIIAGSPSREGIAQGLNYGQSIAMGMYAAQSAVNQAGRALGSAAMSSVNGELTNFGGGAVVSAAISGAVNPDDFAANEPGDTYVTVEIDGKEFKGMIKTEIARDQKNLRRALAVN